MSEREDDDEVHEWRKDELHENSKERKKGEKADCIMKS